MGAIRYVVPGWPAAVRGHSAVVPHFNRHAGAGWMEYKDGVEGQPGTQRIPVNPVVPSPDQGDLAMAGISRSSDAGNWFLPNLYYTRWAGHYYPGAGMPVSVRSDNLMPVPAADPRGIPAVLQTPLTMRGPRQVKSFPSVIGWPASNAT